MHLNKNLLIVGLAVAALFLLLYHGTAEYSYGAVSLSSQPSATPGMNQSYPGFNPGPTPQFSCQLLSSMPERIAISNVSGMSAFTVNGVSDYLIAPGSTGQITYYVQGALIAVNPTANITVPAPAKTGAISAYNPEVAFYHEVQETANYTATIVNGSAGWRHSASAAKGPGNASKEYQLCFGSNETGSVCRYSSSLPSTSTVRFNSTSYDHPGINTSYVTPALPDTKIISISTTYGAQQGTYWIAIAGGPCNGGQLALLTVGSAPYSGSVKPGDYV